MKVLQGIGVSEGIALAPALRYEAQDTEIQRTRCSDPEEDIQTFEAAFCRVEILVQELYKKTKQTSGEREAGIFDAYTALLSDEYSIGDPIRELIRAGNSAEQAVATRFDELRDMMYELENDYLQNRGADFEALKRLLLQELLGAKHTDFSKLERDVVVIAQDLTPSDTVQMDLGHVKGLVCETGGRTSHTSILARSMGIPAIVGCPNAFETVEDGVMVLLDGTLGTMTVEPDARQIAFGKREAERYAKETARLEQYRKPRSETEDGHIVGVHANIGSVAEGAAAMTTGCEGVGLFRTEFLYMEGRHLPDEERQFQVYRDILKIAEGKPVTIRTLDAGGDKQMSCLNLPAESNPFLGYRAIRICLDREDIFRTQLRALYRASAFGCLRIMFPMISSLDELWAAKATAEKVQKDLAEEGIAFDPGVKLGIMVEIPAVAEMADEFAREVDFFSIGTNDLVQYTLAVDRGNEKLRSLYTHYHPAVIRLIQKTIEAAHRAEIPCCMCGEAAADLKFVPALLGLGLDVFSVSASSVPKVREQIAKASYALCQDMALKVLSARTAAGVEDLLDPGQVKQKN